MHPTRFPLLVLATLLVVAIAPAGAAPSSEIPTVQWERLFGGSWDDYGYSVQQTSDGGYVLLGESYSSASGDVTGKIHGTPDQYGMYPPDCWVVKLDAAGAVQWEKLLGGSGDDCGRSVQQTSDGGYVLLGQSSSSASGDITGTNRGAGDLWVVKLDAAGAVQWQKLLGGSGDDIAYSVQATSDGGYVLLGESSSSASGDVTGTNHGGYDFWVVKLDAAGTVQWEKLLGGTGYDSGRSVQQTSDGGYVLLGPSHSTANGDISGRTHGGNDFWVVKLDAAGAIQWEKLLGGRGYEFGHSVQQTSDGGYVLLGESYSSASGDITGMTHGSWDFWVVKLDAAGTVQWQKLLGGSWQDYGYSVQPTSDGGYVLLGESWSSASGDVTGTNHGNNDLWVVKLDAGGAVQWEKLLGGSGDDYASSVQQASDGSYVLLGYSRSSASGDITGTNHGGLDFWVVKLDAGALPVLAVPPSSDLPTDTDADGLYDDVNGNGRKDFADVVLYFNQMTWITANEPTGALDFDYNNNGRIDFADVAWLFNNL